MCLRAGRAAAGEITNSAWGQLKGKAVTGAGGCGAQEEETHLPQRAQSWCLTLGKHTLKRSISALTHDLGRRRELESLAGRSH